MSPRPSRAVLQELEAVEFATVVQLVAGFTRTRLGRAALQAMTPWDGLCSLRRLRQRELLTLWTREPQRLPIQTFDEAFDELMSPAGWLLPEHWRQLREGLKSVATLLSAIGSLATPEADLLEPGTHPGIDPLQVTAALLPDPASMVDLLTRSFNDDGQLEPLRIPALAQLHRDRSRTFAAVQQRLQRLLKDVPDAFQDPTLVERNGRFCLPVRQDRRGSVPGLVLDRSSSGVTVFIEPFEVVPLNNDHVEADRAYTEAVQAYLRQLLEQLRARRFDLERWHSFQGDADAVLALLRWGSLCDGSLPGLEGELLHLLEARHPLLLPQVRRALDLDPLDHDVVALTLELDRKRPGLVISGSNTGGKTVVLKTVGLLSALASAGCAIPAAAGTTLPRLTSLHADIGDHQTLIGSLSTFSSHIVHLRTILNRAKPGGLVLLDELGTGTDPKEGAALGTAVLQALSRRGCWVLCSTHLGDISQFALRHPKFQNASVQFDEERLAPTYRLLVGMPGQSRALTIAAKLGLPPFVLEAAQKSLGRREQDWRDFLRQLEADRLRLLDQEAALNARETALEKDRRIIAQREEQLRQRQEQWQRTSEDKVQRVLDFLDTESKRLVKELKTAQKQATENPDRVGTEARERLKTLQQIAHQELSSAAPPPRPRTTAPIDLKEGGYARHRGLGVEGKVLQIKGDRVSLQTLTGRRMEARVGELDPIVRAEAEAPARGRVRLRTAPEEVAQELNLIGRASDDVDTEVHRFIEESLARGSRFVRIVHGHGTGRLKASVRAALQGHPGIACVEDAPQAQGGAGATLISLK